ncbi:MAG: endopeptidase La [Candidatus Hydrogenedentes bacterium]|nr:endopeptidase La [Candidatus Hydrogenedentota bacterium]
MRLPLLPLKDMVIFPRMVVPLLVGRAASLAAVEGSLAGNQPLFLCTQKDPNEENPGEDGLYRVGVAASILQSLRMPDGTMKVVVEGLGRGQVEQFLFEAESGTEAEVTSLESSTERSDRISALARAAIGQFEDYVQLSQRIAPEVFMSIQGMEDCELVADSICAYLPVRVEERQALLELVDTAARLEKITSILMRENELIRMEHSVRDRMREQMERGQREHYLHEQLKLIHQELGNREEGFDEFTEMRTMIAEAKMPAEVRAKADREFARYERMPMLSPEGAVIRNYLEWLCDMPWSKRTRDFLNLARAQKVLDEDHYGLEKVKDRILEYLAVRKLSNSARGPILCLVGPPGVGKTSLGESIARAMKRKFIRASLGGIRDEAEIRGHRRTYIGALPGRIIQNIKKAGVKNPLFLLDEIDKLSNDFRGDPSSALLEVLDPAQNKDFSDHYLEVSFDLSEVFFIATANNEYDIPHALHDRMEIVHLSGYTLREKEQIARLFLLPRMMADCGLTAKQAVLEDSAITEIIQRYTREAGVRELERQIARVLRKVARRVVEKAHKGVMALDAAAVVELLGPPVYSAMREVEEPQPGIAIGMAWTQVGGDILFIETSLTEGKGKLTLTGQLGNVMKESAEAAYTYIRAHAKELEVPADFYKKRDLHVHVAEGAVPKDGPSAGTALIVSMVSALRGVAPTAALSMTGEITLLGRVLPVGGIKEKVLAAHRAGVKTVLLPRENEKDLPDVPAEVRDALDIRFVDQVGEVLAVAFPPARRRSSRRAGGS